MKSLETFAPTPYPTFELLRESGLEFDGRAVAVVSLDEHLHVVGLQWSALRHFSSVEFLCLRKQ
jgi:hypothetical protein